MLFPFRFRDPMTGKWTKARYRAERSVITARHTEFVITGEPEYRQPAGGYFSPHQQ